MLNSCVYSVNHPSLCAAPFRKWTRTMTGWSPSTSSWRHAKRSLLRPQFLTISDTRRLDRNLLLAQSNFALLNWPPGWKHHAVHAHVWQRDLKLYWTQTWNLPSCLKLTRSSAAPRWSGLTVFLGLSGVKNDKVPGTIYPRSCDLLVQCFSFHSKCTERHRKVGFVLNRRRSLNAGQKQLIDEQVTRKWSDAYGLFIAWMNVKSRGSVWIRLEML